MAVFRQIWAYRLSDTGERLMPIRAFSSEGAMSQVGLGRVKTYGSAELWAGQKTDDFGAG
jgi:hypothetical protein